MRDSGRFLDRLNSINWKSHQHAYGEASDVPELIHSLIHPDETIRREAYYELMGNIWHQRTVYGATVIALPFLIELYDEIPLEDRDLMLILLASIASGNGYYSVHANDKMDSSSYESILEKQGTTLSKVLAEESANAASIRRESLALLPLFLENLNNPESEVRLCVAEALCFAGEFRDQAIVALQQQISREADPFVEERMRDFIDQIKSK